MIKRTVFYSAFAGFLIGFFATVYLNPVLEVLTPVQICTLGANRYLVALMAVSPINGALYAIVGAAVACSIRLTAK